MELKLKSGGHLIQNKEEYTIVDKEVIVELAIRQVGIDVEQYPYISFIKRVQDNTYPIKVKFGLEVCYISETADILADILDKYDFDFLTGSVHWIDGLNPQLLSILRKNNVHIETASDAHKQRDVGANIQELENMLKD